MPTTDQRVRGIDRHGQCQVNSGGRLNLASRHHRQRRGIEPVLFDEDACGERVGGVAGEDGDAGLGDGGAVVEVGDDPMDGAAAFAVAGVERLLLRLQALCGAAAARGGC